MTLQIQDRVKETVSGTPGTGAFSLAGAMTGFRAFSSVCANLDTCWYAAQAVDGNGNPAGGWEVGLGTYNSSGNTLSRTTIYSSSNAGAAVNFSVAGIQVWIGLPAEQFSPPSDPFNFATANKPTTTGITLTANSSATAAISNLASGRGFVLTNTENSSSTDSQACAGVAVSGSWTLTALLSGNVGLSSDYGTWGLYVRSVAGSSSGNLAKFGPAGTNITAYPGGSYDKWTSWPTSPSYSGRNSFAGGLPIAAPIWMRLRWDGTNYYFSTSLDGETWVQLYQIAGTDFIAAPAEAGVVIDANASVGLNTAVTVFHFQKV